VFKGKISAISQSNSTSIDLPLPQAIPHGIRELIGQLDNVPVELWAGNVGRYNELVEALIKLRKSYWSYIPISQSLDDWLVMHVRYMNALQNSISSNDSRYIFYARGMLWDGKSEEIASWVTVQNLQRTMGSLEEFYRKANENSEFTQMLPKFLSAKRVLVESMETVRKLVIQ